MFPIDIMLTEFVTRHITDAQKRCRSETANARLCIYKLEKCFVDVFSPRCSLRLCFSGGCFDGGECCEVLDR